MTILKSEQVLSDSDTSWEDAVSNAVARFSRTVRNVRSVYVNDLSAVVERGKVAAWRANLQVTFEVDDPASSSSRSSTSKSKSKNKR